MPVFGAHRLRLRPLVRGVHARLLEESGIALVMALGIPAKIRPGPDDQPAFIKMNAANYVQRGEWYRRDLRRID